MRLRIPALLIPLALAAVANAAPVSPSARPARVAIVDNSGVLDVNDMRMWVTNTGSFAWDKTTVDHGGLEFPKGSGKYCVFAAGLWMGAQVGGEVRVTVAEYADEYGPGAMIGAAPDDSGKAEYHVYSLYRHDASAARRDSALAAYVSGAVPHGAPPVTVLPDGSLDILGDQMLWAVYNDADPRLHANMAGSTPPLGVEIQQTTYAYDQPWQLGRTASIRYRIINKGGSRLDSTYVAMWSDPDVGYAGDDLVGCDPSLDLGYAYNGIGDDPAWVDPVYGVQVPAVGFEVLRGPGADGRRLGMTAFLKYIGGTDPNTALKSYYGMQGRTWWDYGWPVDPITGETTTFPFSGDPVSGSGWLDSNPADRRLLVSSGPFTMAAGDTLDLAYALVIGLGGDRLGSISAMKNTARLVRSLFDHGEVIAVAPPPPRVTATPGDGSIDLSWDASAETPGPDRYPFQGYVVSQLPGPEGAPLRLATYDVTDGIRSVIDDVFNPITGYVEPKVTAYGTDSGLRYTFATTGDSLRRRPLVNGQRYWFAVSSYSVDASGFPKVLASPPSVVEVVPQPPGGGVVFATSHLTPVVQRSPVPPALPSVRVSAEIVDTLRVRTAGYRVGFAPGCATCAGLTWYVVRTIGATSDTVVSARTDRSGGVGNPVFDGIRVRVDSLVPGTLGGVEYLPVLGGDPALVGVDYGLPFFDGGGGYASDSPGSSLPHGFVGPDVEIRFTGGPRGQWAYRYLRTISAGIRVYMVQDTVGVPFTVWDTDHDRQLTACFLEDSGAPNQDGRWDPDASSLGGREFVWVDTTGYSATPDPGRFSDPDRTDPLLGNLPLLYALLPRLASPAATIAAGDKVVFQVTIPTTSADSFTFSTTAATRSDAASAADALEHVLAVPNPYFLSSAYELGNQRIVKFTHLPVRCTLRIFTLAGERVRTIEKDDDTSQATWDLANQDGRRVASGIYLYQVEAPGIGTRTAKLAVFMR